MICGVDVKRDESPYDLVKTLAQKNSLDRRSLSLDGDVSVDDGAMARATDWLRGAEQRHAEGAEAEAPHVELAIESE
jgi:hypothetical protein